MADAETSAESEGTEEVEVGKFEAQSSESFGLPRTCTILENNAEREVYVVGTAHFSKESQEDVTVVMRKVQPHVVFLELCRSRTGVLHINEEIMLREAQEIGYAKLRQSIQKNGVVVGVMQLLLLLMNSKITKKLGMAPGGEFRRAFEEAQLIPHCKVVYGDRPIGVTIRRAFGSLSFYQKLKFGWRIMSADLTDFDMAEIERCKEKDVLEQMLADMAEEFPSITNVFVNERDVYLAHSLKRSTLIPLGPAGEYTKPIKIVAVLGIGHVSGVVKHWDRDLTKEAKEYLQVPQRTIVGRIVILTVKTAVLGGAAYGLYVASRGAYKLFSKVIGAVGPKK